MFSWFRKKSDVLTDDQRKLKEIISILFPPDDIKVEDDGTKYFVDYSLDSNLQGALSDLEDGVNDIITRNTVRHVVEQLYKVRDILEELRDIPPDTNFYETHYKENKNYEMGIIEE